MLWVVGRIVAFLNLAKFVEKLSACDTEINKIEIVRDFEMQLLLLFTKGHSIFDIETRRFVISSLADEYTSLTSSFEIPWSDS